MDDFTAGITCEEFYDDEAYWDCPYYENCEEFSY